jgi:hypothetical protein
MNLEQSMKFILWVSETRKIVPDKAADLILGLWKRDQEQLQELIATFRKTLK